MSEGCVDDSQIFPRSFQFTCQPLSPLFCVALREEAGKGLSKKKPNRSQLGPPASKHFFLSVYYTQFLSISVVVHQT